MAIHLQILGPLMKHTFQSNMNCHLIVTTHKGNFALSLNSSSTCFIHLSSYDVWAWLYTQLLALDWDTTLCFLLFHYFEFICCALFSARTKSRWLLENFMFPLSGGRQCNTLWCLFTCSWNCSKVTWYLRHLITSFSFIWRIQAFFGFCTSLLLFAYKTSFLWVTLWDVEQVSWNWCKT